MIYNIFHETKFEYASLVTFSHNMARLKPRNLDTQKLLEYSLDISPTPYELSEFVDYFENTNDLMLIRESHKNLILTAKSKVERVESEIEASINNAKASTISVNDAIVRFSSFNEQDIYAKQYLFESDAIKLPSNDILEYVKESFSPDRGLFEACYELMGRIFNDFDFVSGFSDVTTPIEEIFKEKKGVCQDFAQFAISALRGLGIPCRYASGYIQTLPPPGKEKLFGADASHAWFSVYIPDTGWVDFDPTNNKMPNVEYIILGYGRDYLDIAPLKGVVQSSGNSELSVRVNVEQAIEENEIIEDEMIKD